MEHKTGNANFRKERQMRLKIFAVVFIAVSALSMAIAAEKQEPQNLILKEMIPLDNAFKVTIEALVLNQPERIAPAFEEVHKARAEVEDAAKKGTEIRLPRNQKRFKEFVRLDDKFHIELETLLHAAKGKEARVVQRQAHKLLDLCVRCHAIFRK